MTPSPPQNQSNGVFQGDPISKFLFNVTIHNIKKPHNTATKIYT